MSEHIIEALGLSKVTIKDGKVIDVTEPEVEYCPLFANIKLSLAWSHPTSTTLSSTSINEYIEAILFN